MPKLNIYPYSNDVVIYEFGGQSDRVDADYAKFTFTLPNGQVLKAAAEWTDYGWIFTIDLPEDTKMSMKVK